MANNNINISRLSDDDLIMETKKAAATEREVTVRLIALLAEVDARRLYLAQGCSSLFGYCTRVLRLSEHAAYHRIEAARAARQYPVILERLRRGEVTLTTIGLLRPHLTVDNHLSLLDAARHQSKRDVERLVASIAPRPSVAPLLRRVPVVRPLSAAPVVREPAVDAPAGPAERGEGASATGGRPAGELLVFALHAPHPSSKAGGLAETPAAEDLYLLRVTIGAGTRRNLDRARDLLRHSIPTGDPAAILDRALTLLVDHLERAKTRETSRPRAARSAGSSATRHIPAAVRRSVWARDGGRCTFMGAEGRCAETGRLEFHHITPFARAGRTDQANLTLRCRAHNAFEARLVFGDWEPWRTSASPGLGVREPSPSLRSVSRTRSGPSPNP